MFECPDYADYRKTRLPCITTVSLGNEFAPVSAAINDNDYDGRTHVQMSIDLGTDPNGGMINSVAEGSVIPVTITLDDPAPEGGLEVRLHVVNEKTGGFVSEDLQGNRYLTVPEGDRAFTYNIPTVGDDVDEGDGLIQVRLRESRQYHRKAGDPDGNCNNEAYCAAVIARDDDGVPSVSLWAHVSQASLGGHRNVNDAGYAYETEGNKFIINTTLWKDLADSLDVKFRITELANTDFIAAAVTDDQGMTTILGEGDNTATLHAGTNSQQIRVSSQVDDSEAACAYIEVQLLPSEDYMPGINTLAYVQIRDKDPNKVSRGGC